MARPLRAAAEAMGLEALITDDYLEVEAAIEAAAPELILGTQMERHIAKRLGIGCAVISAPVHVQDFPARYAPQMGYEGANVIFDSWIHPSPWAWRNISSACLARTSSSPMTAPRI